MIEKLGYEGKRIFDVELSVDKRTLELREACDMYFAILLTKREVLELANDLTTIADTMVEEHD